jgi:putative transposase
MARPLRVQYPGAFYHVTSRGNERKAIFRSNRDREKFLSYLKSAHDRYGATIHVYCLMDNHYHLLLETPLGNLSRILHHVNGAYTAYFNTKRNRSGHLFQGRFKALLVEKDSYCQELSRYIHLNPVRAGLVDRPSEYRWSSHRCYIGKEKKPVWLTTESVLGYFGQDDSSAQDHYRTFVEGVSKSETKNPLDDVVASTLLGSPEFISWAEERFIDLRNADMRNIPVLRGLVDKPSLEEIGRTTESIIGKKHPFFKKICIYVSHQYGGFSLKDIGTYYGMRGSAISQCSRRFKQRILGDNELKKSTTKIATKMGFVES